MWKIFNFFTIISFKYFYLGAFFSWLDEPLSKRLWNTWAQYYMLNYHKNSDFKNFWCTSQPKPKKNKKMHVQNYSLYFQKWNFLALIGQSFAKRRTSVDFVKLELGVFIVQNVICAFVWAIQETVLLLIIANSCDNSHDIGQRSNHLLFNNIYAFGEMILLHNDYFDDKTYIGFYF